MLRPTTAKPPEPPSVHELRAVLDEFASCPAARRIMAGVPALLEPDLTIEDDREAA